MKDKIEGKTDEAIGKVKEESGKLTGDKSAQIEGMGQQIKGKVEDKSGDLKREEMKDEEKAEEDVGR